jgi:hypothetical protein
MDILATDGLGHHIFLVSTCDNIYGGYLKDNVYRKNPHTIGPKEKLHLLSESLDVLYAE